MNVADMCLPVSQPPAQRPRAGLALRLETMHFPRSTLTRGRGAAPESAPLGTGVHPRDHRGQAPGYLVLFPGSRFSTLEGPWRTRVCLATVCLTQTSSCHRGGV